MGKQDQDDKAYESYLVHNRKHQMGFNLVFSLVYAAFTALIFHSLNTQTHWSTLIIPICLFAVPTVLFPIIQTWEYKPWQAKAQKYERHYRD